jgi:hypothetical protein
VHVPDQRLGRSLGVVMNQAQQTEPDDQDERALRRLENGD